MSLPCFLDLTTPSPWAQWQRLAPRLAPTAPLTPLTSGDTSTLRLPGPEAQQGPEAGQLSIILPTRLQDGGRSLAVGVETQPGHRGLQRRPGWRNK